MIPRISKSYLAMSRSGRIVQAFDSPARCRAFAAAKLADGVRLEAVEQTITLKPLPAQAIAARSDETPQAAQPDRAKARSEGCALATIGGSA